MAGEVGAHVIVTILAHQMPQLRTALDHFGEVPVSLDHCGFPDLADPSWKQARSLFEMAEYEKLCFKITTNVLDSAADGGAAPRDFVARMVSEMGADRLMWGSDFCQTHNRNYPELVALARAAFSGLSEADRAACLGGTAQRLWPALRS